ncbi:MAG: lipopolysaccharide biosynthesis protein, partial [Bacteroidaceae bacterium]|nr:lipopolysaccharide biosynthesis protein [Bacteroidaceae bacterium]
MDENQNNRPLNEEEEGIDIMALVKQLWDGRKTVIIWTCAFIVLGLIAALTMKRTYDVSTVMVPQLNSKSNSSLSSLASLAGFDLGTANTGTELSPLIYPQIVSSVTFRKELMYTPLHYEKCDTAINMFDYAQSDYAKPSAIGAVFIAIKKYTIGLPGVILGAMRGEKEPVVLPEGEGT